MPEVIKCMHCTESVVVIGSTWYHSPKAGVYRAACRPQWGYLAAPEVSDAK